MVNNNESPLTVGRAKTQREKLHTTTESFQPPHIPFEHISILQWSTFT